MWLHQQQLGKLTNSKHLWATLPHHHHEHNLKISTSEQATSTKHKEPFYSAPICPWKQAWLSQCKTPNTKALPIPTTITPPPCGRTLSQMPDLLHPRNVPSVYANQKHTHALVVGSERHQMPTKAQPMQFPIVVMWSQHEAMPNSSKVMDATLAYYHDMAYQHRLPSSDVNWHQVVWTGPFVMPQNIGHYPIV